ncbi:MAG: hypothetical protein R6T96_13225 [Longimicrobiales bacterium]
MRSRSGPTTPPHRRYRPVAAASPTSAVPVPASAVAASAASPGSAFSAIRSSGIVLAAVLFLVFSGCATLQEMAALSNVEFSLDRLSNVRLAGIELDRIRDYSDLGYADAARLTLAVSRNELPLAFDLHLLAENPADNATTARLMQMDWTLLLEDRETLSGVFDREVRLPPGQPTDVPIAISLDLLEFFDGSAQDLLELALSLAGHEGEPKEVALRATPTIDTALGPMRYPRPITIVAGRTPGF